MTRLLHRQRPVEAPSKHRTPAWPGRPSADDSISFADIAAMPDPDWIGRSQQAGLALDAELLEPLELTDWSARIAADWSEVNACWDLLKAQAAGAAEDFASSRYSYYEAWKALFTALADNAAELDDDRAALFADIATERMLIDQWSQYAKSFMGLAPGATAKGQVA